MRITTSQWIINVTTGDWRGFCRALRESLPAWYEHALNTNTLLVHDDDPDSDRIVSFNVEKLSDMLALLNLIASQKHIASHCIYVTVSDGDIKTQACIGSWTYGQPDEATGQLWINKKARTSAHDAAIREAISILEKSID